MITENENEEIVLENPTLLELEKDIVKAKGKKEEGTYEEGRTRYYTYSVTKDKRHYVKFIVYPGWYEQIKELNHSSLLMLFYILHKIGFAQSKIKLERAEFCKAIGISSPTYYAARDELISKNWLIPVPMTNKEYFINLRKVVNGPVEAVYKEYEFLKQKRENKGKEKGIDYV